MKEEKIGAYSKDICAFENECTKIHLIKQKLDNRVIFADGDESQIISYKNQNS